ncbi:MAG TPA: hypothetical protein VD731_00285 [Nitrosopumilaceae archaeon]|nr:hypothetical protein [Nitrosopumilaceae archaeon]
MKRLFFLLACLLLPGFLVGANAHTVDSVGEYRLEIGWMSEPVVSGQTNGIELYVSSFDPNIPVEEQNFKDGITGLEKFLKIELVFEEKKIILPLNSDHNIPGKYYAFVVPTVSGYYQANLLGTIKDTNVSISMHPPKVDERGYIEFPEQSDVTLKQIIAAHTSIVGDISDLKESVNRLNESNQAAALGYAGITLGTVGTIIASIALFKTKR